MSILVAFSSLATVEIPTPRPIKVRPLAAEDPAHHARDGVPAGPRATLAAAYTALPATALPVTASLAAVAIPYAVMKIGALDGKVSTRPTFLLASASRVCP